MRLIFITVIVLCPLLSSFLHEKGVDINEREVSDIFVSFSTFLFFFVQENSSSSVDVIGNSTDSTVLSVSIYHTRSLEPNITNQL